VTPLLLGIQLERNFLDRFFPTTKYLKRKQKIASFKKQDVETLYDAWEMSNYFLKGVQVTY